VFHQSSLRKCGTKNLAFPSVEDPANPPLRPERHVANSIATIRKRLAFALVKNPVSMPMLQGDPDNENRLPQQFVTQ
jgi:hypothetical protein